MNDKEIKDKTGIGRIWAYRITQILKIKPILPPKK